MSRSRSMEAISQEGEDGGYYAEPPTQNQPTLFTKRSTLEQQQNSRKRIAQQKQHRRNELFMGDEDMPIHSFHSLIGTY